MCLRLARDSGVERAGAIALGRLWVLTVPQACIHQRGCRAIIGRMISRPVKNRPISALATRGVQRHGGGRVHAGYPGYLSCRHVIRGGGGQRQVRAWRQGLDASGHKAPRVIHAGYELSDRDDQQAGPTRPTWSAAGFPDGLQLLRSAEVSFDDGRTWHRGQDLEPVRDDARVAVCVEHPGIGPNFPCHHVSAPLGRQPDTEVHS